MVRFTPGFSCFVALCAVTACFPGVILEVDARAVPTRHEAAVKATPIPLPHKASSQSYKDPTYTVGVAGATAVLSPPKAHHSARPSGEHGKHGSSHEKPKEPKHEDGSEKNTKVKRIVISLACLLLTWLNVIEHENSSPGRH